MRLQWTARWTDFQLQCLAIRRDVCMCMVIRIIVRYDLRGDSHPFLVIPVTDLLRFAFVCLIGVDLSFGR